MTAPLGDATYLLQKPLTFKKGKLSKERIKKLEALGMIWDV